AVGGTVMNLHLRQALRDVQRADQAKTAKLWTSPLDRARALRTSGRVGQRFEALKAIREAAQIKVRPGLRAATVAALVMPAAAVAGEWEGESEEIRSLACDAKFERYARINQKGELTVYRLSPRGEEVISRTPAQGERRFLGLWMSPDGRFVAYGHS